MIQYDTVTPHSSVSLMEQDNVGELEAHDSFKLCHNTVQPPIYCVLGL